MATPLELVAALVVSVVLAKAPLAPPAGAVKVTFVPDARIGLPWESSMVTCNRVPNVAPTVAF